jgi:mono/diheme cytochrome c family protein
MKQNIALILLAMTYCGAAHAADATANGDAPSVTTRSVGKQVFDQWCAACHAAGPRYPGTASLASKYGKEKPAALEQRRDLTPDLVSYFVRHGVSIMPPFRKTEVTDAELQELGTYLSHASAKKPNRKSP